MAHVRRLSQLELALRANTIAELQLEAFLPADEPTAEILRRRWG